MQTVRLLTEIVAPVERCYRLALHTGLAREAMAPRVLENEETVEPGEMSVGAELRWAISRKGVPGRLTETLTAARARVFLRKSLTGDRLEWGELEQHFAPINDGTRLWEEVRFRVRGWWLRGFRERRIRRSLLQMLTMRSEAVKEAAESERWRQYLGEE